MCWERCVCEHDFGDGVHAVDVRSRPEERLGEEVRLVVEGGPVVLGSCDACYLARNVLVGAEGLVVDKFECYAPPVGIRIAVDEAPCDEGLVEECGVLGDVMVCVVNPNVIDLLGMQ